MGNDPKKPAAIQLRLPLLDLSFIQIYSHALKEEHLCAKIGPYCFSLWVILRSYCATGGKDAGKCFLSHSQMAKATNFSLPTIHKSLKQLEEYGLIKSVQEGPRKRKYYVIDVLMDKSSGKEIIAIEYHPPTAASTRQQLSNWTSGRGDYPQNNDKVVMIQQNINQNAETIVNINFPTAGTDEEKAVAMQYIKEIKAMLDGKKEKTSDEGSVVIQINSTESSKT